MFEMGATSGKVVLVGSSDIFARILCEGYLGGLVILYSCKPNPLVSNRKVLYVGSL